ncbi:MAG TPA: DUF3426 domain-containing protein, partial [Burkholderiaceae bacterium]|nr:DUF3426 domain-containing protein [Burkholderiaceae bacterium]
DADVDVDVDVDAAKDAEGTAPNATAVDVPPDPPAHAHSPAPVHDSVAPAAGAVLAAGAAAHSSDRSEGADADAVDFFAAPSRARGFTSRTNAFAMMACVALSATLLFQAALAGRDWLAAWVPALEPALGAMSNLAGLSVQAPRSLGALTLESFELQAGTDPGALTMNALLRNRAGHVVRWPGMELTLTDGSGTVVVRKQLLPADYLGRGLPAAGVPAGVEQALTVSLQGVDLQPTGYNVKLFYP